ncbi:MAG: response regulator transcription factor [Cyclobacteriaceae bacterium]|nr:response regulator transcription factor [Cyclobacteriaceae bacterium]MCH8515963.1 response regulator transcription factor [Cyclobacteriaceae bacterium]
MPRVIIADDHSILRQGTKAMLESAENIDVLYAAADGEDLYNKIIELRPDIVISDITMPGKSIFEIIVELKENQVPTKILILSMHESEDYVKRALEVGVSGYLTKYAGKDELLTAIKTIYDGEEYYSRYIAGLLVKGFKAKNDSDQDNSNSPLSVLSKREKEVLSLLAQGLNTKDIAEKLFLSERTVSNHRSNMIQKCGVKNTFELVSIYFNQKGRD